LPMHLDHAGLFLSRKYKEAKRGTAESSQAFEELNDAADPDMVVRWEEQEKVAQASRIDNPSALDVYDVRLNKGESRAVCHDIPGR
jgi:hypothetical protein